MCLTLTPAPLPSRERGRTRGQDARDTHWALLRGACGGKTKKADPWTAHDEPFKGASPATPAMSGKAGHKFVVVVVSIDRVESTPHAAATPNSIRHGGKHVNRRFCADTARRPRSPAVSPGLYSDHGSKLAIVTVCSAGA